MKVNAESINLKTFNFKNRDLESVEQINIPDDIEVLNLFDNEIKSFDGLRLPSKLQQLDLGFNLIKSLEGLTLPLYLQKLDLRGNLDLALTEMDLKKLSATMMTELKINSDHPMANLVTEFNKHQLKKVESAAEFLTQVISGDEEINLENIPKIMSSIAYVQHSDQMVVREVLDVSKLGGLVTSCMQKSIIDAPDDESHIFNPNRESPECILTIIYEYWCGDKLPITMINLHRDFTMLSSEAAESTESEGSGMFGSDDGMYEDFWWGSDNDTAITDDSMTDILGGAVADSNL